MILTKIFGGMAAVSALAALVLYALLQVAWSENALLEQQKQQLTEANEQNIGTIKDLMAFQDQQAQRLQEAGEKRAEIQAKTQAISRQLDKVRFAEAQRALEAPFERGNAARTRRERILMQYVSEHRANRSAANPGDTETGDSSETESAGN